ncbi:MAG: helix-turn-helix domain-containing protein [Oscillospiraceae bacterium]|nr:helix-turn-helix domain-containing protein [Oscillospiraceae bacterium]
MEINEILKALRQQKHLTQQELATTLSINISSYQKYERPNNTIKPSIESLIKIADFYGVSTDYLLGRTTVKQMATEQPDLFEVLGLEKSFDDDEFMRIYSTLPDIGKQILVDVMARLGQATTNNSQKKSPHLTQPVEVKQTGDDEYIIQTTTVGKEMDRMEAERARQIADARAKKNAV